MEQTTVEWAWGGADDLYFFVPILGGSKLMIPRVAVTHAYEGHAG